MKIDLAPKQATLDAQGFWNPKDSLDWPAPILLRRLRIQRGWTQRELAGKADVAQSHVAKVEAGRDVRFSTIERLVGALGCKLRLRVSPVAPFEVR